MSNMRIAYSRTIQMAKMMKACFVPPVAGVDHDWHTGTYSSQRVGVYKMQPGETVWAKATNQ
jgi:hypothetical protein